MSLNIVLDVNVILDLLLKRGAELSSKLALFDRLKARNRPLYFAACALPVLEHIHAREIKYLFEAGRIKSSLTPARFARRQLNTFVNSLQIISTPASAWNDIPENHPDMEDALISLSAAALPGENIIWSENRAFKTCDARVLVKNHEELGKYLNNIDNVRENGSSLPFIDLATQQMTVRSKLEKRIFDVLKHGKYIMGPEINELEEKLAAFAGAKHCIGCASGTNALLMALMAMDVGAGDAIFTTPFTFIATTEVIGLLSAMPVFVDINPSTFNMDPAKLELAISALNTRDSSIYPLPEAINHKPSAITPKGVIPVDLFGLPCDYDRINAIAEKHGLFVIEDAAQGFGGEYRGKRAGSLADIGCTSFFPAKPLGCYGDGGAVFTDSDEIADRFISIRIHGKGDYKHDNARIGLNARLDTLQAAILNAKFDIFPEEIKLRNQVASKYSELLSPLSSYLLPPLVPEGYKSAWAQYSVLSDKKEQLQSTLQKKGIPTAVYYPKPLHLQTAFEYLGYKKGDMPVSEDCSERIFSLPMHPYLKDTEVEHIVSELISALEEIR